MIEVNFINSLIVFLLAGFIGWLILFLFTGHPTGLLWKNEYPPLPFKPFFAFGTLLVFLIYPYLMNYSLPVQFILYALILTGFEWFGFFILQKIGVQFKCYYNGKRIALLYSIYWGLFGLIISQLFIQEKINMEIVLLALFLVLFFLLFRNGFKGQIVLNSNNEDRRRIC
jgi:hypothetical protein